MIKLFLSCCLMIFKVSSILCISFLTACGSGSSPENTSNRNDIVEVPVEEPPTDFIESITPKDLLDFYVPEQELFVGTDVVAECNYQNVSLNAESHIYDFSESSSLVHKAMVLVYPRTEYEYKVVCTTTFSGVEYEEVGYTSFTTPTSDDDSPTILKLDVEENKILIKGYNFDEKLEVTPFIHEKFEDGNDKEPLSGDWTLYRENNKGPYYTVDESYSGDYSVRNVITSDSGTEFNTAWQEFTPTQETYASYRFKFILNENVNEGIMKLARITSDYSGESSHVVHYNGPGDTVIQYQPRSQNEGWLYTSYNIGGNNWQGTIPSKNFLHNEWNRIEIYKKLSSPFNVDGEYRVKLNNELLIDKKDVLTRASGYEFESNSFLLPLMFANPDPGSEISMYVDDVYVDDQISRVELANCPVYEQCLITEIQTVLSWGENLITIMPSLEKLSTLESVYLFVIDNNGVSSNGSLLEL